MKEYLNLTKDQFISTNSLCDFARIILTENYFEIRTDIYLQKRGIEIDMKFAPQFANFFMTGLEK